MKREKLGTVVKDGEDFLIVLDSRLVKKYNLVEGDELEEKLPADLKITFNRRDK